MKVREKEPLSPQIIRLLTKVDSLFFILKATGRLKRINELQLDLQVKNTPNTTKIQLHKDSVTISSFKELKFKRQSQFLFKRLRDFVPAAENKPIEYPSLTRMIIR